MTCNWLQEHRLQMTEAQWVNHVTTCADCLQRINQDIEADDGVQFEHRMYAYFEQFSAAPSDLPERIAQTITDKSQRMARISSLLLRKHVLYPVSAAIVLILATTFHTPIVSATSFVTKKVQTAFFPHSKMPIPVTVVQIPQKKQAAAEQDMLTPANESTEKVFNKHRSAIVSTYKRLQYGEYFGMTFDDGQGFTIMKYHLQKSFAALENHSPIGAPVLNLPSPIQFDYGLVMKNPENHALEEMDMFWTPYPIFQEGPKLAYEKYTSPAFELAKGTYIYAKIEPEDGTLSKEIPGSFSLKKVVHIQGNPGILVQYAKSWKPNPGIVELDYGIKRLGRRYDVSFESQGVKPATLLKLVQAALWR